MSICIRLLVLMLAFCAMKAYSNGLEHNLGCVAKRGQFFNYYESVKLCVQSDGERLLFAEKELEESIIDRYQFDFYISTPGYIDVIDIDQNSSDDLIVSVPYGEGRNFVSVYLAISGGFLKVGEFESYSVPEMQDYLGARLLVLTRNLSGGPVEFDRRLAFPELVLVQEDGGYCHEVARDKYLDFIDLMENLQNHYLEPNPKERSVNLDRLALRAVQENLEVAKQIVHENELPDWFVVC